MSTESQVNANRANAKLSTGPATPAGKAKCSLNAVKTGLTGRTVLLPTDDAAAYQQHLDRVRAEHKPATEAQQLLVQSIAETEWRLLRIPALESNIYAVGRLQFANLFEDQDAAVRTALIEAHTYLTFYRQLSNLSIQEARLRRQREKDLAALAELKKTDAAARHARLVHVAIECMRARHNGEPSPHSKIGSEFSISEIEKMMEAYRGMRDNPNHSAWERYPAA
jgi:hypothetical protein